MVHMWLWSYLKIFFTDGISGIVNHHTICVEKWGDYIEKWYSLHLSQNVAHEVINKSIYSALYITRSEQQSTQDE